MSKQKNQNQSGSKPAPNDDRAPVGTRLDLDHLLAFLMDVVANSTERREKLVKAVEQGKMIDNGEIERESARRKAAIKSIRLVQSYSVSEAERRIHLRADNPAASPELPSNDCPFRTAIAEDDDLKSLRQAYFRSA